MRYQTPRRRGIYWTFWKVVIAGWMIRYPRLQAITNPQKSQAPPASQNPHKVRTKIHQPPINTHTELDRNPSASYNRFSTPTERNYVSCLSVSTEAAL